MHNIVLASLETIRNKVIDVFSSPREAFEDSSDPDRMLYSGGFFSPADRHLMNKVLAVPPAQLGSHSVVIPGQTSAADAVSLPGP